MFFSHIPTRTVGKQQDYRDQAHHEYDTQIEPEGLDMPAAQYFFTAIERGTPQFVVWRQINDTAAWHQIVANDVDHPSLVGTSHKLFQFDVIVVLLQFQERIFTLCLDGRGYHAVFLECEVVASFGHNPLSLLHIFI